MSYMQPRGGIPHIEVANQPHRLKLFKQIEQSFKGETGFSHCGFGVNMAHTAIAVVVNQI